LFSILLLTLQGSPAHAAKPVELSIEIVQEGGEPLPTADVRFAAEGQLHRVHTTTAMWKGTELWAPGGTQIALRPDMKVKLEVVAPGFERHEEVITLAKKGNAFTFSLTPVSLSTLSTTLPTEVATEAEAAEAQALLFDAAADELRTLSAVSRWKAAAEAYTAEPTDESEQNLFTARAQAASASKTWLDTLRAGELDESLAFDICRSAEQKPARCDH